MSGEKTRLGVEQEIEDAREAVARRNAPITVALAADDARDLFDLLGERGVDELWSTRVYVALGDALGEPVAQWMRLDVGA